jgi:hypothetical protein
MQPLVFQGCARSAVKELLGRSAVAAAWIARARTFQQLISPMAIVPAARALAALAKTQSSEATANTTKAITPSTAAHPDFAYSTSLALCGAPKLRSADAMGFAHQSR